MLLTIGSLSLIQEGKPVKQEVTATFSNLEIAFWDEGFSETLNETLEKLRDELMIMRRQHIETALTPNLYGR